MMMAAVWRPQQQGLTRTCSQDTLLGGRAERQQRAAVVVARISGSSGGQDIR
jgi:hypothetical protein